MFVYGRSWIEQDKMTQAIVGYQVELRWNHLSLEMLSLQVVNFVNTVITYKTNFL